MHRSAAATVIAILIAIGGGSAGAQNQVPVAALAFVKEWVKFSDPQEGAFQADVPKRWKAEGGTFRLNALQYRNWLKTTSPDVVTTIVLNDPTEDAYVIPTPMLVMAGFAEGSLYSGGGGTVYRVARYQTGAQFASSWGQGKLASLCHAVQVAASQTRPELTAQINTYGRPYGLHHDVGEAIFTCTNAQGEAMSAYVLASILSISDQFGAIWYAETIIGFASPMPVAGVAAGLLAHIVRSVEVNPAWVAHQTQTNMDVSRIATQTNNAISDSVMHSWESKGAVIDRIMEQGSRARLGIEIYQDPATGTEYTVANTHRFNWVNPQGTVVGTDTDDAPKGFSRLARVPP
jgi:hypothetical protein